MVRDDLASDKFPLTAVLMDARGHEEAGAYYDLAALECTLEALIADGRSAWPEIQIPDERVIRFVGLRVGRAETLDVAIRDLRSRDVYLACAALAGHEQAIAALDRLVGDVANGIHVEPGNLNQDVAQEFREKLLVGCGSAQPLLARYNGTASLRSWLRLMMVRRVVHLKKRQDRGQPFAEDIMEVLAGDDGDPELSYLKQHYLDEFRSAFRAAILELQARDQNLLRYLVLEGLTVGQVAAFFGVNRVTISKRLQKIRQRLFGQTRLKMSLNLRVTPDELDSIIQLIRSRLDVTLTCLAEAEPPSGES